MGKVATSGILFLAAAVSASGQGLPGWEQALMDEPPATSLVSSPPSPVAEVTIPPGTHALMLLSSAVHTTSGTAGSGLYLETVAPVVIDGRVVIPVHTLVQGTVEGSRRPGHFRRTSEFQFHFTTLIFPNNSVLPIDAVLQSIPGSRSVRSRSDDGTIETVDQTEKVLVPAAAGGAGGAIIGSNTRLGIGKFVGAGLGAGLALGSVFLQRGDDISLPRGTNVEMVFRGEARLTQAQAAFNAGYIPPRPSAPFIAETPAPQERRTLKRRRPLGGAMWPLLTGLLLR